MKHRRLILFLVSSAVLATGSAVALAQGGGPFGVGAPEPGGTGWAGPFAPLFAQIAAWQADFYQRLTEALAAMNESGSAFWLLAGVSFLYGIFHAAGPGHGKAVISAYVLASGQTLKRGVAISFAAAFVQALTAIVLVSVLAGILNLTSVKMTETVTALEIGSYGLIVLIGAWILWTRIRSPHRHHHSEHLHHEDEGVGVIQTGRKAGPTSLGAAAAEAEHHHGHHAPDPSLLTAPLTMRSAWAAVLAVGIRPCSGAVIILVFALSQTMFVAGIASTFVMALGTAITVASLASLAVFARGAAARLVGGGKRLSIVLGVIEIGAAAAVLIFGLLLLGGALTA